MAARKGRMPAVWIIVLFLASLLLPACAVSRSPQVVRVALLGPFEGRYREVGYNALYAARLALREGNGPQPALLAVDDGGSLSSAVQRAEALALDPLIYAVIAVGYHAADPATQAALGDLPVLIPGGWTTTRARDNVFLLSDPALAEQFTIAADIEVVEAADGSAPMTGGDVLGLEQFPLLRESVEGVTLLTSGQLPALDFATRYADGQPFAPQPNLLAMLVYDATALAAASAMRATEAANPRSEVSAALAATDYEGLSGRITFADGIWQEAPQHAYRYDAQGELVAIDDLIEQR